MHQMHSERTGRQSVKDFKFHKKSQVLKDLAFLFFEIMNDELRITNGRLHEFIIRNSSFIPKF
jgi:hypothetical protein